MRRHSIKYDIDVDGFEGEAWDNLPNWVKDKVRNSKQYQELAPDTTLPAPSEEEKENLVAEKPAERADDLPAEEEEECPF